MHAKKRKSKCNLHSIAESTQPSSRCLSKCAALSGLRWLSPQVVCLPGVKSDTLGVILGFNGTKCIFFHTAQPLNEGNYSYLGLQQDEAIRSYWLKIFRGVSWSMFHKRISDCMWFSSHLLQVSHLTSQISPSGLPRLPCLKFLIIALTLIPTFTITLSLCYFSFFVWHLLMNNVINLFFIFIVYGKFSLTKCKLHEGIFAVSVKDVSQAHRTRPGAQGHWIILVEWMHGGIFQSDALRTAPLWRCVPSIQC